jgi:hypothetical protein
MGTSCVPRIVNFSFFGIRENLSNNNRSFILTFMHIIDLLSINNPNFANWIPLQNNEDTKGVIRSRKSKKDRQYNGQEDRQ